MHPPDHDLQLRRLSLKLGLRNGLLIGLALALGAWTPETIALSTARVRTVYPPLLLGLLALLLSGGLAGWLAAWRGSAAWGGLVWFLSAGFMTWAIGHLPYEGSNLIAWLADRRFWGLSIYPFSSAAQARLMMTGFFVVLLLSILGLLQGYRLEGVASETDADGHVGMRAWFLLVLPLPLVFGAGLIADNLINSPLRVAPQLVHKAIRTGRTYPGDLFELSLAHGVNYNAIAGVRDQMSAGYSLNLGQIDLGAANSIVVVAHFDNGAWINCRVTADQLFHCYDASPPYRQGFPSLLATGETPQDCRACTVKVSDEQRAWLLERGENLAGLPHVTRLAQWGSYVWMRAEPPTKDYAVDCLFHGISPLTLDHCQEARTTGPSATSKTGMSGLPAVTPQGHSGALPGQILQDVNSYSVSV
jgi:hypothetical protein